MRKHDKSLVVDCFPNQPLLASAPYPPCSRYLKICTNSVGK
jgi:hypothetical protein